MDGTDVESNVDLLLSFGADQLDRSEARQLLLVRMASCASKPLAHSEHSLTTIRRIMVTVSKPPWTSTLVPWIKEVYLR